MFKGSPTGNNWYSRLPQGVGNVSVELLDMLRR